MAAQDPNSRRPPREPVEEPLQADPLLRRTTVPWGWGLAIAAALVVIAILVFGTTRDDSRIAGTQPSNAPVTTGSSGPAPPPTSPNSGRGNASVPPASTNAARSPSPPSTTGSGQ